MSMLFKSKMHYRHSLKAFEGMPQSVHITKKRVSR